jgi:hypothetical protein
LPHNWEMEFCIVLVLGEHQYTRHHIGWPLQSLKS